jgi:hypothetical protein
MLEFCSRPDAASGTSGKPIASSTTLAISSDRSLRYLRASLRSRTRHWMLGQWASPSLMLVSLSAAAAAAAAVFSHPIIAMAWLRRVSRRQIYRRSSNLELLIPETKTASIPRRADPSVLLRVRTLGGEALRRCGDVDEQRGASWRV